MAPVEPVAPVAPVTPAAPVEPVAPVAPVLLAEVALVSLKTPSLLVVFPVMLVTVPFTLTVKEPAATTVFALWLLLPVSGRMAVMTYDPLDGTSTIIFADTNGAALFDGNEKLDTITPVIESVI
ncbi:hypothetical protein [Mesorhizobium australicum]|uniref:hypothetical protein n=1 Tax=Mesorhizobium australicum TaxID=536018 RepID=UPI00333D060E